MQPFRIALLHTLRGGVSLRAALTIGSIRDCKQLRHKIVTVADSLCLESRCTSTPAIVCRPFVLLLQLSPVYPLFCYSLSCWLRSRRSGIRLKGGMDTRGASLGIHVADLLPDSAAARDGRILEGDRIISVNGELLDSATNVQYESRG